MLTLAALPLAYLGVAAIRRWAARGALLDVPNERSSHVRPTPRGGGLAIVLVTLGGWLLLGLWYGANARVLVGYFVGAALIAGISWLDDLRGLSNRLRFGVHIVGAMLAVAALGWWQQVTLPLLGTVPLGGVGLPVTLLWIVGLTNAYNFMDGIDGLAGSQAVVAGAGWALWGVWQGQPLVAGLGTLVAASSLGFLGHNWPPARIFMGDVGSAFLGYTFAVLPLLAAPAHSHLPLAAAILLWPFLFDSGFTFLRRWRQGENVFAAHRSHLYQRLVLAGHSHRRVTLLYIAFALGAVLAAGIWLASHATIPLSFLASYLALWLYVRKSEQASKPG